MMNMPDGLNSRGELKKRRFFLDKKAVKFIRKRIVDWMPGLFTIFVCLSLLIGWRLKRFDLITPGHGTGYILGILGTICMVILFIYSLRKRIDGLKVFGSVKAWFRIHMVLGIIGPVLILFHANFHLGALNSNVALFSMLIVVLSGIIGRYIYTRIHYGLYGHLADLKELQDNFAQQKESVDLEFALIPGVKEELLSFTEGIFIPSMALTDSIRRFLATRWKSLVIFRKIERIAAVYMKQYAIKHKWGFFRKQRMKMQIERKARIFLNRSIKVAEFNFYERLFSSWHILHIPLVFVLVFSVIVHVVAANRY